MTVIGAAFLAIGMALRVVVELASVALLPVLLLPWQVAAVIAAGAWLVGRRVRRSWAALDGDDPWTGR